MKDATVSACLSNEKKKFEFSFHYEFAIAIDRKFEFNRELERALSSRSSSC